MNTAFHCSGRVVVANRLANPDLERRKTVLAAVMSIVDDHMADYGWWLRERPTRNLNGEPWARTLRGMAEIE